MVKLENNKRLSFIITIFTITAINIIIIIITTISSSVSITTTGILSGKHASEMKRIFTVSRFAVFLGLKGTVLT